MATFTWTGAAGDGNFTTDGNWLGGAAPEADSQDYVFDRGSASLTAGLTTGLSAGTVTITPGFSGNIGSTSAPLVFTGVTSLKCAGSGQYVKIGSSGTIAAADVAMNGEFHAASGTWTLLTTSGPGPTFVDASAIVTTLRNAGSDVTVGTNVTAITTLTQGAGTTAVNSRNVTTANVKANRLTLTGTSATTKINIERGAEVLDQATGTASHVEAFPGGAYRLMGLAGNKTITDRTRWTGAIIDSVASGVTVTLTNPEATIGAPSAPSFNAPIF